MNSIVKNTRASINLWILPGLFFLIPLVSLAQTFSVTCNGETVPVFQQNDVPLTYGLNTYKYAACAWKGEPLNITVEAEDFEFSNSDWDISPKSYQISGEKNGNKLAFTINRTGYVVVRFKKNQDFAKRIVLFVEPPELLPEGEIVDIVKTYNVDNTGKKNETNKIQQAFDDISGSGKTLLFPEGIYKTYQLKIKSNSNIHLTENARILADASTVEPYLNTDGAGTNRFVFINGAQNIRITGRGGFDGNGTYFRGVFDPAGSRGKGAMRVLFIRKSKNILIDGILLKDPSRWNTHMVGCEDIVFRNCKILSNPNPNPNLTNFDGWDPDASKRILIENCFGWSGDDNIAVKCVGTGDPKIRQNVEDITIRGCVFLTKKSALKIGTETRCDTMRRITFENNDIIESDRAFAVDVQDEAVVDGVLFNNNRVEYNYPDSKKAGINISLKKRNKDQPNLGKIQNVVFENCSFENRFPNGFIIYRDSGQTNKSDVQVTFKNLTVESKRIKSVSSQYFDLERCNVTVKFE